MLPRDERRALAVRHGFKSIGEFEEHVTLTEAVGASGGGGAGGVVGGGGGGPYDNEMLYRAGGDPGRWGAVTVAARTPGDDDDEDDDDTDGGGGGKVPAGVSDDDGGDGSSSIGGDDGSDAEDAGAGVRTDDGASAAATERGGGGGLPCLLPDDVHDRVFSYLDVHAYAIAALVSPHWRSFTRTEHVYRRICRRSYLNQSRRGALRPHRFGGSYRTMLERRPRVRTGGGVYALRYSRIKKIQRDMWTEIPAGAILETAYYRYFYFHESGRVLYALTSSPPGEVLPRFARALSGSREERERASGYAWGGYEVRGRDVAVRASHPWHDVRMELRIADDREAAYHGAGKNCALAFVRHQSSASGNFDERTSRDLVEYKVPDERFVFLPDRRL